MNTYRVAAAPGMPDDLVDVIQRTALGKAPLIRRAQLATAAH